MRHLIFTNPFKSNASPDRMDHLSAVDDLREEPAVPTPVLSEMDSATQKECLRGLFGEVDWQADYDYKVERSRS